MKCIIGKVQEREKCYNRNKWDMCALGNEKEDGRNLEVKIIEEKETFKSNGKIVKFCKRSTINDRRLR